MGWGRVAPSRLLLFFVFFTTAVYSGGDYIHYPAAVLAATAVLAALSVLPGACGVSRDSKATLVTYCVVLLAITGGELAGSSTVFSFAYTGKVKSEMSRHLHNDVMIFENGDNSSSESAITKRINRLQSNYACCGVDSYKDWNNTAWKNRQPARGDELAPESCCKDSFSSAEYNCTSNSSMLYNTGCVDVLLYRMDIAIDSVLGVCVLAAAINLGTVLLACRAVRIIRRYKNYSVI